VELQSRLESASRRENCPPIAQDSKTPAISNASSLTHSTSADFVAKDLEPALKCGCNFFVATRSDDLL